MRSSPGTTGIWPKASIPVMLKWNFKKFCKWFLLNCKVSFLNSVLIYSPWRHLKNLNRLFYFNMTMFRVCFSDCVSFVLHLSEEEGLLRKLLQHFLISFSTWTQFLTVLNHEPLHEAELTLLCSAAVQNRKIKTGVNLNYTIVCGNDCVVVLWYLSE